MSLDNSAKKKNRTKSCPFLCHCNIKILRKKDKKLKQHFAKYNLFILTFYRVKHYIIIRNYTCYACANRTPCIYNYI